MLLRLNYYCLQMLVFPLQIHCFIYFNPMFQSSQISTQHWVGYDGGGGGEVQGRSLDMGILNHLLSPLTQITPQYIDNVFYSIILFISSIIIIVGFTTLHYITDRMFRYFDRNIVFNQYTFIFSLR